MVWPSGSSAPSRRTSCGCTPSTPSRTCGARCGTSRPTTTPPGSSPGTDIALPTRSAPTSDGLLNPTRPTYPWLPERRSWLSREPGALHHEGAAVVVAERKAAGGAGGEATELLADGHA